MRKTVDIYGEHLNCISQAEDFLVRYYSGRERAGGENGITLGLYLEVF